MAKFLSFLGGALNVLGIVLLLVGIFAVPNYAFADLDDCYADCDKTCDCENQSDPEACYANCLQPCYESCDQKGKKICGITKCTNDNYCYWYSSMERCALVGDPVKNKNENIKETCFQSYANLPCRDCVCEENDVKKCVCKLSLSAPPP